MLGACTAFENARSSGRGKRSPRLPCASSSSVASSRSPWPRWPRPPRWRRRRSSTTSPKEDLFFADAAAMDSGVIIDAIRERPAGESPSGALRRLLTDKPAFEAGAGQPDGLSPAQLDMHQQAMWVVQRSPALRTHLREQFARLEASIAELLAEETGASPENVEPRVVAAALVGVIRAVSERFLTQATADQSDQDRQDLMAALAEDTERALDLLERGLGGYAVAAPRPQPAAGDTEPEGEAEPP